MTTNFKESFAILIYNITNTILNNLTELRFFTRLFKVLCMTRMTIEWLPVLNPYVWPISLFYTFTNPYFRFFEKIFPTYRGTKHVVKFSHILAIDLSFRLFHYFVNFIIFINNISELYIKA